MRPATSSSAWTATRSADARGVQYRLTTRGIGQRAKLDVVRKGQRAHDRGGAARRAAGAARTTCATSRARIPSTARASPTSCPRMADELGSMSAEGVVILSVRQGSTAARLGFQPGDIIAAGGPRQDRDARRARGRAQGAPARVAGADQARRPDPCGCSWRARASGSDRHAMCAQLLARSVVMGVRLPSRCDTTMDRRHDKPVPGRRHGEGGAAAACRPAAPEKARRGGGPGSPGRRRRHADAHAQERAPAEHDPVGAARHRQDHGGAAAGGRDAARLRAAFRDLLGRAGPAQGLRPRQEPARDRQGHAALHRRDPPLQPLAAGQLPAAHGGRHHHAGRRHHGEPLLRAQRRTAVACAGAGVPPARRGRARAAAGARGAGGGPAAAARCGGPRDAQGHGRRRRPHGAQHGRGGLRLGGGGREALRPRRL